MLPIQFILLLILASIPREIADSAGEHATTQPAATLPAATLPAAHVASPLIILGSLLASQLLVAGVVWMRTRAAIRALQVPSASATAITMKTDLLFGRARWLTIAITGIHLFSTPMPETVLARLDHTVVLKYVPMLPELLFIAPAVLTWLAIWAAGYFVESAVHERGLPYRLAREAPVHEMPTLPEFLSMQMRHNFFPLLLLFLKATVNSAGKLFQTRSDWVEPLTSAVGFVIILFAFPWLLVRMWSTTPLMGPLRERLDRVAQLHRLRFRDIRLWKTHNLVNNAAILGWVPFTRYFLMTDSLLETFSDPQLEAVFAHEVGHGVHRHIPWYFATFMGALLLASGVTGIALNFLPHGITAHFAGEGDAIGQIAAMGLMCAFVAATLPFISARFEHQADWFACRHMAKMLEEQMARGINTDNLPAAGLFSAHQPLPAELQWSLSTLPADTDALTIEQYIAGNYPHAASPPPTPGTAKDGSPTPTQTPPAAPVTQVPVPQISLPIAAAWPAFVTPARHPATSLQGAEIFISALDSLVEASHRSREKRGWMHPSINDRIRLLRELACTPAAAVRFDRLMVRTRMAVVALLLAGIAATAIGEKLSNPHSPSTQPTTIPAHPDTITAK